MPAGTTASVSLLSMRMQGTLALGGVLGVFYDCGLDAGGTDGYCPRMTCRDYR